MVELGPQFNLDTSRIGGHDVVVVKGEIDIATAPMLDKALAKFSKKEVFLDLRKTEFMDSAGMGVLHRAANWAGEEGWTLSLTGPRPNVRRVLSLTNLA